MKKTRQPPPSSPSAPEAEERPLTDTMAVEDLPEATPEEKATNEGLLAKAEAKESTGQLPADNKGHVFVRNDTGSLFAIGLPAAHEHQHAQNAHSQVVPGVNRIPVGVWELAKKQKMVQLHIREGNLVEVDNTALEDLSEKGAIKLVEATAEKKLLLSWKDSEKRDRVLAAINKNLKLIAPSKPKKEKEEGQDEDESDDQE